MALNKQIVLMFVVGIVIVKIKDCDGDPCKSYKQLGEMERRYVSYKNGVGELDTCDKYLPTSGDWYYAEVDMPITPPQLFSCGTTYPIWFNGTLPQSLHEQTSGQGCIVRSKSKECTGSYPIKVRKCESFSVYFLKPTDNCPEAYCFGFGIEDTPPKERPTTPEVKTFLEADDTDGPTQDIVKFKCFFGENSSLLNPFYQVSWIVNKRNFMTKTVHKDHLADLYLTENHLSKFDITLACVVRAKNVKNGRAGPSVRSKDFYAGIVMNSSTIAIKREEEALISFRLTVPFGCLWRPSGEKQCDLTVQMMSASGKCSSTITSHSRFCRQRISNNEWNQTQHIIIKYKGMDEYTSTSDTYIVPLTVSSFSQIWNGYKLQPVRVTVKETRTYWQGKTCSSHNDPHMTTFDGRRYEHQYEGIYILYEHHSDKTPMQVLVKLKSCHPPYQVNFCNCGVAVRAGGDVYIVDICDPDRPFFGYRTCHDKLLDVRRSKTNEKHYTIFFPTGTKVVISMSIEYFNVDIKASVFDMEKTRGLCGYLDDNCKYDFVLRDGSFSGISGSDDDCSGSYLFKPTDFSKSWRISNDSENLFLLDRDDLNIGLWQADDHFCECPTSITEANEFECSPSSTLTCKRDKHYDKVGSNTCNEKPERRKRSIEFPWKSLERFRKRRSVKQEPDLTEKVSMTKDEAIEYCKTTIGDSAIFNACSNIPNIKGQTSLENCAFDIQLSNSTTWTKSTMDSLKSNCFGELIDNNTLEEVSTASGQSIVESVMEILCPGLPECSNNGQCVNGTCICNDTFIASDCSIDKRRPPEMFGVRGDGLCDLSEIDCSTAFGLGHNIGNSPNLTCKITKYHILKIGEKQKIGRWISTAKLETIMEVHCPLKEPHEERRKRDLAFHSEKFVEVFDLSFSYDMEHFGREVIQLVVFDSRCQIVDPDTSLFALKNSTCFIDGICYLEGQERRNDICSICNPKTPYEWSIPTEIQGCIKVNGKAHLEWIAGPVIGGILLITVTIAVYLLLKKRSRAKVKEYPTAE